MRNKIAKKLHSNTGASISFALFAFIIATIVSLIIVAAALTNVIKVRQERENEQAYLLAQSVANLISEQVLATDNGTVVAEDEDKYTSRYVKIVAFTDGEGESISALAPVTANPDEMIGEPFKSAVEELCKDRYIKIENYTTGDISKSSLSSPLTVSVSNAVAGEGGAKLSDEVIAKLNDTQTTIECYMPVEEAKTNDVGELNKNVSDYYDMDVVISVPTNGTKTYKCTLHFDASLHDNGNATYIYWTNVTLRKGDK